MRHQIRRLALHLVHCGVIGCAAFLGGAYRSSRSAAGPVVVGMPVGVGTFEPLYSSLPVVVVGREVVYWSTGNRSRTGEYLGDPASLGMDAPLFSLTRLEERLEGEAMMLEDTSPDGQWPERTAACELARNRRPELHILCPGRTVIVEVAQDTDPHVLSMIVNAAWKAGFHAAVTRSSPFPTHGDRISR